MPKVNIALLNAELYRRDTTTEEDSSRDLLARITELEQELAELRAGSSGEESSYNFPAEESDRKFRSLFNGINQPVIVHPLTDRKFKNFIEVNSKACEIYGYSRAEFLQLSPYDITDPSDEGKEASARVLKQLSDTGHVTFESIHVRKDSSRFPVEISSSIFNWEGQEVFLSIIRDITQRKHAEESMLETEERFKTYITSSPNGIIVVDHTGRCIEANQAACDTSVFSQDEILGKSLLDFIKEHDHDMMLQKFAEVKEKGKAEGDFSFPREDGSCSYWKINAVKLSENRYVGFVSDVTEIKQAERDSLEREKFILSLVNAIPSPVFYKDRDGLYLGCNLAYTEFIGVTAEQMRGKKPHELLPERFTPVHHEEDMEYMENPGRRVFEVQAKNKEGQNRSLIITKDVIRNESGEVNGLVGAFLDVTDTKVAREELLEEKKKLESIFRASPTGIGRTVDFIITDVNVKICQMTGFSRDELLGENISMLFRSQEEFDRVSEDMDNQINELGTGAVESVWKKSSGEEIHILLNASTVTHDDLREGLIFTALDITESKRASEALHRSEQQLRLLVDNTVDVIWKMDLNYRFTYVNPAIFDLAGYTTEEWIGSRLSEHTTPVEFAKMTGKVALATKEIRKSKFVLFESKFFNKSGEEVPVEIIGRLVLNNRQEPVGLQGTTRDISQRKKAEEALKDSDAYLAYLFKNVPAGIIIIDKKSRRIVDVNSYACSLIGLTKNVITGCLCTEFICVSKENSCPILDMGEQISTSERNLRNSKGELIPILKTAMSARFSRNEYIIEIFSDLSGRIKAEEQRAKLEHQLHQSQKMESIGTMAGGIAHDFNNLLTVINGYSEMVLEGMDENDPLHEKMEQILFAGISAGKLTSQLLAFSRKELYRPETVEINSVFKNMEKMIRRLIGEDITISTVLKEGIPGINADRSQLEQIFLNLVVNARDAVYEVKRKGFKKHITIETGEVVLDREFLENNSGSSEGRHVFIAVSDNGIGIEPENRQKIFEPFFTTKEHSRGTGLGLSTVYGIVKQNGGNIQVSSVPELGSTFHVYWPALDDESAEDSQSITSYASAHGSEKILVVEDNEAVRNFAYEALSNLGYNVSAAENGRVALDMLEIHQFTCDLIITDLIMPEVNGKEFAEKAKLILPEVEVIYMSGYTDGNLVHEGMLDRDINFIQKPYTIEALAAKVRQALDSV